LRSVGLNHRLSTLPRLLSGGEQQRVAIARAVVNQPELLLADEPTGNLDPDLAVEIMRLFREVNAKGTTVIVATHDRDLIQRMQRRTVVLSGGEVTDPGERKA
jgi:cell division transport system ATP-binding protein